jgi:hypothetical protein
VSNDYLPVSPTLLSKTTEFSYVFCPQKKSVALKGNLWHGTSQILGGVCVMANGKELVERRKHKRFQVDNGAFVRVGPHSYKMGRLIDISMGGLAFHYVGSQEANESYLAIFLTETNFYLDEVPIKTVWDLEMAGKLPSSSITVRRHGVQFVNLPDEQRSQVQFFINNHTIGEA